MICNNLTREQSNRLYLQVMRDRDKGAMKELALEDLYYLLTIACSRRDANNDWVYERCREVERNPDGYLDLWAREHFKSSIITFALTIQEILNNPEITVGIFSHTRPIAKGFLEQIKVEFEKNEFLKSLFPEVLYQEPRNQSQTWSLDGGIVVKRKSNPKEKTVEAWGLVDGQPTSKHFGLLIYDDVVTLESVSTPEQIAKTTDRLRVSYNLGTKGGKRRFIGTRYHFNDTYREVIDSKAAAPRVYAATIDGTVSGEPLMLTREELMTKRAEMGPYVFACQMLQNPKEDSIMGFKEEWLRYYTQLKNHTNWNYYIVVDPAGEKKKTSDYTVILVIALGTDNNYYLVDGIRDRLNLTERTEKLFYFVRKYLPLKVGYEKYGLQSDIEHIKFEMERQNYRFEILELRGQTPKNDRIRKLIPTFEQGRFWLPLQLKYIDYEDNVKDLIYIFIKEEYTAFPVSLHDDILDCMARVVDKGLNALFPNREDTMHNTVTMGKKQNMVETEYDIFG